MSNNEKTIIQVKCDTQEMADEEASKLEKKLLDGGITNVVVVGTTADTEYLIVPVQIAPLQY